MYLTVFQESIKISIPNASISRAFCSGGGLKFNAKKGKISTARFGLDRKKTLNSLRASSGRAFLQVKISLRSEVA
jgi:hypothetical protein